MSTLYFHFSFLANWFLCPSLLLFLNLSVFNFFFLSFAVVYDTRVPGFADVEVPSFTVFEMYSIRVPAYTSIFLLYLQAWLFVFGVPSVLVPILSSKFDFLPNPGYVVLTITKLFFVTKINNSRHFLLLAVGESVFLYILILYKGENIREISISKSKRPAPKIIVAKLHEV